MFDHSHTCMSNVILRISLKSIILFLTKPFGFRYVHLPQGSLRCYLKVYDRHLCKYFIKDERFLVKRKRLAAMVDLLNSKFFPPKISELNKLNTTL